MNPGHYFCSSCMQAWSRDPDKHLMACEARRLFLAEPRRPQLAEHYCIKLTEAPRRRQGARYATRRVAHGPDGSMSDALRDKLVRTLTPSMQLAMLVDDLSTVRAEVLRGLKRRGLARIIGGRNPFWAFTPLGRRLRFAMREQEASRGLEGWCDDAV